MNGKKIENGINNRNISNDVDFYSGVSKEERVVEQSNPDFPRASEASLIRDPRGINSCVPLFQFKITPYILDNLGYYELKGLRAVCKYLYGFFESPQPIIPIQEFWNKTSGTICNRHLTNNGCGQSMIDFVKNRNLPCQLALWQFYRGATIEELLSLAIKLPEELRLRVEAIRFVGLQSAIFISLLDFSNLIYTVVDGIKSLINHRGLNFISVGKSGNLIFKPRGCEAQSIPLDIRLTPSDPSKTLSVSSESMQFRNIASSISNNIKNVASQDTIFSLDMNLTSLLSRCIQEYQGISSQEPFRLNLDPSKKKTISETLVELLNKAEFLFVAQVHDTFDGKVIVDNLPSLKKNGLTHIALEIPSCQQKGVDHYIATGDDSLLASPYNRVVKGIEYKELIERSKDLELKIVAFDAAITTDSNVIAREITMARNLVSLIAFPGKKLVMTGGNHVRLSELPYRSARSYLALTDRTSSAISLQSLSGIMASMKSGVAPDTAMSVFEAYAYVAKYYGSWLNKDSFAFPASGLGDLAHRNPAAMSSSELLPYAKNYDYVFFLNENDSRTNR